MLVINTHSVLQPCWLIQLKKITVYSSDLHYPTLSFHGLSEDEALAGKI